MEILEKLFGSAARVKILKLFLVNTNEIFDRDDIARRAKVTRASTTKELNLLVRIGFLRKRSFFKEHVNKRTKKVSKKRAQGFVMEPLFPYISHLRNLLVQTEQITTSSIAKRITRHGKVKLIITSGVFIQDPDSRIDLLVVGDGLKTRSIQNAIALMESEIGTELRYALFSTKDFRYRLSICDRLVRDVLDYPHDVVVDKFGLGS